MVDVDEKAKRWAFPKELLLASLPVAAYLFVYLYEVGYADYFGIPKALISINPKMVLLTAVGIAPLAALIAGLAYVAYFIISPPKNFIRAVFVRALPFNGFLGALLVLFGAHSRERFLNLIILMAIMTAICLCGEGAERWVNWRRSKRGQTTSETGGESSQREGIVDKMFAPRGRLFLNVVVLLVGFLCVIAMLARAAGISEALRTEHYYVVATEPELVVLRIYGDTMVCVPFTRDTRQVQRAFQLIKLAEDPSLIMRQEKIGPLHVDRTKKPLDLLNRLIFSRRQVGIDLRDLKIRMPQPRLDPV